LDAEGVASIEAEVVETKEVVELEADSHKEGEPEVGEGGAGAVREGTRN
jgi:hypothetical protein